MNNTISIPTEIVILIMFFGTSLSIIMYGYLRMKSKKQMLMIEKGLHTDQEKNKQFYDVLKIALTLIGAGIGLFLAFLLVSYTFDQEVNTQVVYFAFTALFSGLGLLGAFIYEKNNRTDN